MEKKAEEMIENTEGLRRGIKAKEKIEMGRENIVRLMEVSVENKG